MKIAVCIKQAIDTEAVITLNENNEVVTEGAALIIDPYAEFAVEKAIQLKEELGGEVVLVLIGDQDCVPAIRHGLSMGADSAILIEDVAIDQANPQAKARVLSAVMKELAPDLIMGGCKSGDTASGQTMPRMSAMLDMPQANLAVGIEMQDGNAVVSHEMDDGIEVMQLPLPAVVSAQQGLAIPRYPKVPMIMKAKKKPIETRDLASLGIDPAQVGTAVAKTAVMSYALKEERKGGRIVEGETPDAVAETLSLLSSEAKVL